MSVPYTSYQAAVLQYAIAMLSNSPTFIALIPNGSVAGDIIVESVGGYASAGLVPTQAVSITGKTILVTGGSTPFAVVHEDAFEVEEVGLHSYSHSGIVNVQAYSPLVAGDGPADSMRRVRNIGGGIAEDINSLFGPAGYFSGGHCVLKQHMLFDPTTDFAGYGYSLLQISWRSP